MSEAMLTRFPCDLKGWERRKQYFRFSDRSFSSLLPRWFLTLQDTVRTAKTSEYI
jgi:hypothetical protein